MQIIDQSGAEYRLICPHCGRANRSDGSRGPNVNCANEVCARPLTLILVGS